MSFSRGYQYRVFRSPFSGRAAMNQDSGFGCLLMVFIPLMLIVSTYLAWWELRFLIQGRTAVASVTGVQQLPARYSLHSRYVEVSYTFKDEGTETLRSEHDDLPISWPRPVANIEIQYVSGYPGGSRVAGHRHLYATLFFLVCVSASVIYTVRLVREAGRAIKEDEVVESTRREAQP
jgi:hypothetical protein